ncbi:MAG TPA: hypothetical protein VFN35_04065 [Ktedonobacteraceae bacterium]|nr:hypothetical protein [Ktedonobacteraceae bacterium]
MSDNEETMTTEEQTKNNRFSFMVGIGIAMFIVILLTIFSLVIH